jgi:hypothetical protein
MNTLLRIPKNWNPPNQYFLTYDFSGEHRYNPLITMTRNRDRKIIMVIQCDDCDIPTTEELHYAFGPLEGENAAPASGTNGTTSGAPDSTPPPSPAT